MKPCFGKLVIPNVPRFELMKPCFGKLVIPNVPGGHRCIGEKVKVITPQGHDHCYHLILKWVQNVMYSYMLCLALASVNSGEWGIGREFQIANFRGGHASDSA